MTSDPRLALACDLAALAPAERGRRAQLAESLRANTVRWDETETGYAIQLRDDPETLAVAEELMALENRCCSFLTLRLVRDRAILEVSGAPGAKAFIAAEMDLL